MSNWLSDCSHRDFIKKRHSLRLRFPVRSDQAPLLGFSIRADINEIWVMVAYSVLRTNLLNEPVGHPSGIEMFAKVSKLYAKLDRVSLPATSPRFTRKH